MFIQLYDKICQGLVHNFVIQYKHDTGNGIRGEINFIVIHDEISKPTIDLSFPLDFKNYSTMRAFTIVFIYLFSMFLQLSVLVGHN